MDLGKIAFRIGRGIGRHPVAGRLFCLSERVLPVRRIARKNGLVAFHHPRPIADPHVLVVPTRPIASLTTDKLSERELTETIWRMVQLSRSVASATYSGEHWQFVINGGVRQDIGQLHGHLMHANNERLGHLQHVIDPAVSFDEWKQLLGDLHEAARIPENGYSLVFQWNSGSKLWASVT